MGTSGTQSTGALTATTTFSLVCTGAGGTSPTATATVTVSAATNPVPTAVLTVAPPSITSGAAATLTWSSTDATACTASGGWTGTLAASGTQSTGALTATTTYSLVCTGAGGTSPAATATVTVSTVPANPVPAATLVASPTSIASGAASTLTWSSTNATACTASGGWSGALATSGTQSTGALTATTTYTLVCTGAGGTSLAAKATVTVVPVPTVTLTATPPTVVNGGTSMLTWSSSYATSCTASNSWSGMEPVNGSAMTAPVSSSSLFTLTCTGIGGTSTPANKTVNVKPTATLTANPTAVTSGATSLLTWSSSNATACLASGGWAGTLMASGTQTTAALTATSTYGLTCSGAGGTSSPASATVTIATGTLALSPSHAELTVSQTQQFTATVPGGGTPTWSVSGYGSGNGSVGTISSSGLYTAGTTAGNYSIVATSGADSATAPVAVTDLGGVYTYHNDLSRDGANSQEYALNTSNVNTTTFGKLASCTVDGAISAQPLWVANLTVNGAQHNVVFVATQNDSVYAFDADASACSILWQVSLIDSAHGATNGEVAVPNTLVGAGHGDIQPIIGVTGTPVIDPTTKIMYVVSKSVTPATSSGNFYTRLHALNILTGGEIVISPIVIQGSFTGNTHTATFVTQQELQRPGLALVNGTVYVGFGAHEDQSPFYGWMMSYKVVGGALTLQNIVNVAPDAYKAGIWMSGGAPAADSSGNIYAITGNGSFDVTSGTATTDDYGDSLVQFNPSLHVTQYFTPSDESGDNTNDVDYGAGGAALLADLPAGNVVTHALVTAGKDGILYVLNRDSLGGLRHPTITMRSRSSASAFPLFATGATWNYNFYIGGSGGNMNFYQVNTSTAQLTKTSATAHVYGYGGTSPSVSALATQNGIVWSLDARNFCMGDKAQSCGPVVLWAHDATNANALWNSSTVSTDAGGNAIKFNVPTVANGRVYVGTAGNANPPVTPTATIPGELDIYGLKP